MGPASKVVLVGLLVVAGALLVLVAIAKRWPVKALAAVLALVVALFSGALMVNDYYGYYTSWSAAWEDLNGSGNAYAVHASTDEQRSLRVPTGQLLTVRLPGPTSGIDRAGLVYLPPQYGQAAYRSVRFPVLELLHGTPGDPASWVTGLHTPRYEDSLLAARAMGPVVLVMPDSNGGLRSGEECLDTPTSKDDTYVSQDVPADVRSRFRVSRDPAQWGLLGFSSGGYCAANLMLRHRDRFGSMAAIDGYYQPTHGPAAAVLANKPAAEAANDPLRAALNLAPGVVPLPACWIAADTGQSDDYAAGVAFARALRRLESVPFVVEHGANHTIAGARAVLPSALEWSWQQLAGPDLRVRFPTGTAQPPRSPTPDQTRVSG